MQKLSFLTARILVISPNESDRQHMKEFFLRTPFLLTERDFTIASEPMRGTDDYHFAIFDAHSLPPMFIKEDEKELSDEQLKYLGLLNDYLLTPIRYVVWYGEQYHYLNRLRERCPAANSKFSLFARIREMMDFLSNYDEHKPKIQSSLPN